MAEQLSDKLREIQVRDVRDYAALEEAAAELDRRKARLTALEEALTRYGRHKIVCLARKWPVGQPCDCGLDAALKG